MPQDYDGNGSRIYVVAQITLLLAAIAALLFSSILFGIGSSLGEINTSIPIIAVIIVLLGAGMTKFPSIRNKYTYMLMMSLIVAFLLFLSFVTLSQNLDVKAITFFTMSAIFYMILGLLAAVAISFAYFGKAMFITWEKTQLWRDLFFMACGVWLVFGITAYLSVVNATPFSATAFIGVPFSASNVAWTGVRDPLQRSILE